MNDLYHWHAEEMVKHEMREIDRAMRQSHLLEEAGLSRTSLLARGVEALRSLLKGRSEKARTRRSRKREFYQSAGED